MCGWRAGAQTAPAQAPAQAAPSQTELSREEKAQFLLTARIISSHNIPKGITSPIRETLTNGTLTHDAVFSTVDEHIGVMKFASGRTELDFVHSYKYSVEDFQALAREAGFEPRYYWVDRQRLFSIHYLVVP